MRNVLFSTVYFCQETSFDLSNDFKFLKKSGMLQKIEESCLLSFQHPKSNPLEYWKVFYHLWFEIIRACGISLLRRQKISGRLLNFISFWLFQVQKFVEFDFILLCEIRFIWYFQKDEKEPESQSKFFDEFFRDPNSPKKVFDEFSEIQNSITSDF